MSVIFQFYNQLESIILRYLSQSDFFKHHLDDPISIKITSIGVIILFLILLYKLVFYIGLHLQYWELPGKEYFIDKPVHCAHVYIDGHVIKKFNLNDKILLKTPLKYHIEFAPEDFENNKDPELGSTLGFTRTKLYFLFKDSSFFESLNQQEQKNYKISDVLIYLKDKELKEDSKALCLHGVETGFKLDVYFNII